MIKKSCPIKSLFNDISKMWVLDILWVMYEWETWFNAIKTNIPGISSKVLSDRLKELQEKWFVDRNIISEQPVKIEYSLTKKWFSFTKETEGLNTWAEKWYEE